MKKSLLLSAALVAGVCAYAQEGTDITPANYKIQDGAVIPFHPTGVLTNININPNGQIWSFVEGEKNWNDGLVVISSGGGLTQDAHDMFVNSINYLDLGGEVGRVMCWINKDSKVLDSNEDMGVIGLREAYPDNEEVWSALKQNTSNYGGGALNFFLDPSNCPTTGYMHAKFVFNVHDADFSGNTLNYCGVRGDQNDNSSKWNDTTYTEDEPATKGTVLAEEFMDPNTGDWDPTRWCVYEFDFTANAPDSDGIVYTPIRLKFFPMNGGATNDQAWFIKEIQITHFPSGEPTMLGTRNVSYLTLEPDFANAKISEAVVDPDPDTSAVGSIGTDVNAPVEYYNLQGVKVLNPENGIFIKKQGNKASKVVL